MSGRVTFENVAAGVAPRSIAASSRVLSRLAIFALTMNTTYEMENATCAAMIVLSPNALPTNPKKLAVAKPITISGMMIGRKSNASTALWSFKRYRASASAAAVPIVVDMIDVATATTRLERRAPTNSASRHARPYHRHVNPLQTVLNRELLNDRTIRTTIGA